MLQPPPPAYSAWAGFLSYLVPGLGQIYQGRVGKGLLFLVCIYGLFFSGMYLGSGEIRVGESVYRVNGNVFLPDTANRNNPWGLPFRLATNLYNRPQFLGQFWVGVVAWPAIVQYATYNPARETGPLFGTLMREPSEHTINKLQQAGDKRWDLGWVYTVIAGVLNIMAIYDAYAGPAFASGSGERSREDEVSHATPSAAGA
jgi:hypothetical protein